jgi:hypothetical protein
MDGPSIAEAAPIGGPARGNMLAALMDGGALTAKEVAFASSPDSVGLPRGGKRQLRNRARKDLQETIWAGAEDRWPCAPTVASLLDLKDVFEFHLMSAIAGDADQQIPLESG